MAGVSDWESHRRNALDENIRDLREMGESDATIERRLGIDLKKYDDNKALMKARKERSAESHPDPHQVA